MVVEKESETTGNSGSKGEHLKHSAQAVTHNTLYFKIVPLKPIKPFLIVGKGLITDKLAPKNTLGTPIFKPEFRLRKSKKSCIVEILLLSL
jgi:hypothetical protein